MKSTSYSLYLQKVTEAKVNRAMEMYKLWLSGLTYERIGLIHGGISRERVRQLINVVRKPEDRSRPQVDITKLRAQIAVQRLAANEDRCQVLYGCSYARFKEIQPFKALRKYTEQKRNAKVRNISWEMTLDEWWSLWEASGKWSQRSRGGYVMCRNDDKGPYKIGNVRIATCSENIKEAISVARKSGKRWGAPYGPRGKQKNPHRSRKPSNES